ncbi:methylated-DNA--[protein]-cysteine S-methyltransferase [Microbacterium sp.]|jgi:methylated-DNA-[protein]-cysteine S-methyltransferase|uniref:methylated-DNA--[protein]-cysteine S-methyltransferase n=1 Tax=Microbacterium sp. TaxID=51671 RepID=UPI0037C5A4FB
MSDLATALIETVDTPDGPLVIFADAQQRVLAAGWTTDASAVIARIHPVLRPGTVREARLDAADAARAYYGGALDALDDVLVRQQGTELQLKGWSALRRIAPGEPLTYTEFAATFGSPTAVRAAASICARNAPALFVPCHRVLRSDGSLGGFAWGLPVKASLLAHERRAA